MGENIEKLKIAWHPAFYSAAEFDLRFEKNHFIFEVEHNLSKEPLRIDLLIIKKEADVKSDNEIARDFRKYNIVEYKSPDDGLTIDDLYKTIGYACLYKASGSRVNEIPATEITISLFRERYPGKLVADLKSYGKEIVCQAPGVYAVKDFEPFPIQIVVIKELDPLKHVGLRMLSKRVDADDVILFLRQARESSDPGDKTNVDSILQVSISANPVIFNELRKEDPEMCQALKELMKDEIAQALKESELKVKTEIQMAMALKMFKRGDALTEIADLLEVSMEDLSKWLGAGNS